ncbi:hypothetical protein GN244_ATG10189 [Phytophthora infestans]|uniref:Uncharacterized protein n=1 Tax=Phytophthora infestans TaxID=4787 RepID=A0A833WCZ8_PHYIN|nr:hypothetical protein GN244_ATG10189 [Phytophthora infestans]
MKTGSQLVVLKRQFFSTNSSAISNYRTFALLMTRSMDSQATIRPLTSAVHVQPSIPWRTMATSHETGRV